MSLYDKNISEDKKASLEFAEAAREQQWRHPSFALQLFSGEPDWRLIYPFPSQTEEDRKKGDVFLKKLEVFLKEHLDPDEVDRTGEIPQEVIKGLAEMGAFAIKVPSEYGGLGLSQVNYNRAMHLLASYCGSTAVFLSAHQSIGVPQPLKLFGTEEQKKKYFPLFAKGAVSAFALTEPEAGSDPRNMSTTATPIEDGKFFLINGEKLWCTNGPIADVLVVMAVTPPKKVKGREIKQITAFIVETRTPGFEVVHRCSFMGLNGIQNGLLRFRDVKVPRENIILGEGEGLKLALTTLNTGRLTLPAASAGVSKWCLHVARQWAKTRRQWGAPIGEHETIAAKLSDMAAHTFAIDAITWLTSAMADDAHKDIRLEAAIAKYFATHHSYRIADMTLQIRGGQGYETASSLKARGMTPWPVERVVRDLRINLIIEGTSEIMHLFIAREALDPHLSRLKPILVGKGGSLPKLKAVGALLGHYAVWYPRLFVPSGCELENIHPVLMPHIRFVAAQSRALARHIFACMMKHQKKLESKQIILNRIVDIGVELFAISAACVYADYLAKISKDKRGAVMLADTFCRMARQRVLDWRRGALQKVDKAHARTAKKILADELVWLEEGIIL